MTERLLREFLTDLPDEDCTFECRHIKETAEAAPMTNGSAQEADDDEEGLMVGEGFEKNVLGKSKIARNQNGRKNERREASSRIG